MTSAEAEANYKAAKEALDAFLPTEHQSRDDYVAGDIDGHERDAVLFQFNALMRRFDEALVAMAPFTK